MDTTNNSPDPKIFSEFAKHIPEDILARIIRRSGKGSILNKHRDLTLNERIGDASTLQFKVVEIKEVLEHINILGIFMCRNIPMMSHGIVYRKRSSEFIVHQEFYIQADDIDPGNSVYHISFSDDGYDLITSDKIINILIHNFEAVDKNGLIQHIDTAIPDIHTVYEMYRRRFIKVVEVFTEKSTDFDEIEDLPFYEKSYIDYDKAKELAVKATINFLDQVVEHFTEDVDDIRYDKLPSLFVYLLMSGSCLKVINFKYYEDKYNTFFIINPDTLEDIERECNKLYEIIKITIPYF